MPTSTLLWFFIPPVLIVAGALVFFVLTRPEADR